MVWSVIIEALGGWPVHCSNFFHHAGKHNLTTLHASWPDICMHTIARQIRQLLLQHVAAKDRKARLARFAAVLVASNPMPCHSTAVSSLAFRDVSEDV